MLKDGFLRFCDNPEIACCKAEKELERLRNENAALRIQLSESQRREQAAVEDIARLVASTPDIKCSIVCDGDCLDCTGSATGTPRGYHYRGPQEAEKGEAE